jgi:hypothetical protein
VTGSDRRVSIDFAVDDDMRAVVPFLERLGPLLGQPTAQPWTIDLRNCSYLGPDAAVVLMALLVQARMEGREWRILLPEGPPALVGFCRFSGLTWEATGRDPPDPDHPRNETLRLTRFMRASWNLQDPLIRLVQKHIPLSTDAEDHLRTCLGEVLQNIEDHSVSPIGGVLCARYLKEHRQVRIAVVDRGLGIRATLLPRYPHLMTDREALASVVKGGMTARTKARNAGRGLSNIATFAVARGGDLAIVSGHGLLRTYPGLAQPVAEDRAYDFQGTAVFFTLHVDI